MSQSGKLMPNLDQNSTKLLNLTVLQRIDPNVEEILITAAHVTFYEFNIDLSQWSRKDVEGSLFVVKRKIQPRFQFIVMNRRNTENLVENILGDFEFEIQLPYLLYRNAAQEVNGIWFYNARECEEVSTLFGRIINAYSKGPSKSMISSSKSEFEELEAVPTMAVMDGPLELSLSTPSVANDGPVDLGFMNFFSSATNMGNHSNIGSHSSSTIPGFHKPSTAGITTRPSNIPPKTPILPPPQAASNAVSTSASLLSLLDSSESSSNNINRATSLVTPSSFFALPPANTPSVMGPVPSSTPTAPPLQPLSNLHRPYGAPVLQPFPPPTPPPSLTPTSNPAPSHAPVISRENVREALLSLVQDNQFIDMFHRALLNAHNS